MSNQEPTIASILRVLAREYDGPVDERQVLDQVLARRPSAAKNPYATIRERLRWDGLVLGWLRLSRGTLMPLHVALQGLRFRCIPRARDVEAGMLPLAHIQPFAGLRSAVLRMADEAGALMPFVDLDLDDVGGPSLASPGFNLSAWYDRVGFVAGDSILVTVVETDVPTLRIIREPAADVRRAAIDAQDAELLDAIVSRVSRAQVALIPCDEVVLPIFAAAPWRAGYPGSPWQHLVTRDGRLQLVDDIFLTSQNLPSLRLFASAEVFEPMPVPEDDRLAADTALLSEIDALQRDLRRSREQDADTGLWNGQIQRASAAYSTFDYYGDEAHARGGSISSVDRYDDLDGDDDLGLGGFESDDLLLEDDDFVRLQAAHDELMSALPPGVADSIEAARPEEAEVIIAQHLNMLLVKKPHLFPILDLSADADASGLDPVSESLFDASIWQEDVDDDEWGEIDDDLLDADDESASVYAESSDLIGQFHDYLSELGKSSSTARARSRNVLIYAEFLASYYNRTLASGDYATLDECLFYHYPRRVLNTSPRQVREICTSVKQFYSFMKERGVIADDRFAHALWRRRDQASRIVQIYDRITSDSPNFEALFSRLFHPYTE
ncbi:hypothetical protein K2Z83_16700 [Oscillochloris sp. ZM17-4]|uniref:hypothetical protein n=1 Tax=Oscillochloris sp. ZM17-4 TaxID=2866714 RepID=UPI001C72A008|nr:hypothetical protein [Oscillochloris sp. ZM17-4]MBX0329312.1 hypothetical protein [Oscillochloris sp. ZM17-4]